MAASPPIELVCPAGSLPALKTAIDNGADTVYLGFKDATNARNFTGLNFDPPRLREGIAYAHARGRKVLLALNTYPQAGNWPSWTAAVDRAAEFGVDAVILADPGLMDYAAKRHPGLRLHLSVQGSATSYEAINYYQERFGIQRAVLPRVLSLAQVESVIARTPVEIEVFGFGGLCVMVEGRCALSAYATGESPNCQGACSPGRWVRWEETPQGMETRLNGILIDRFAEGERTGYPTLCKGRFEAEGTASHLFEDPTSLNAMALLAELRTAGVRAVKIEGRQRSKAYVARVAGAFRDALDALDRGETTAPYEARLTGLAEGGRETAGAYRKAWR